MRRADRLFDIIQLLRSARRPMTAATLAAELEVTVRTVYRDIAALQASRVPIEGEAGIGYVLKQGFDLPPLMLTLDEVEAVVVGARLIRRTGDPGLRRAAERVLAKVTTMLPDSLRAQAIDPPLYVSETGARPSQTIDLADMREAIRARRKLRLHYVDEKGLETRRIVRPIAIAYYVQATLVATWCELRRDYRHFRADRIAKAELLDETFEDDGALMEGWLKLARTAGAAAAI
jgi:predicted DNA-binding transcriptional regulator YafY